MSQLFSLLARSHGAAPLLRSHQRPGPLQAARPLSWWRQETELKPSAIDLIEACVDAARATVATTLPDTNDLDACYEALEDHIRVCSSSDGELTTLDLLASALLVAIDGTRDRFADCVPLTLMDLCAPLVDDGLGRLPEPNMATMAYSLLQDARWHAAFKSGNAFCREVRQ